MKPVAIGSALFLAGVLVFLLAATPTSTSDAPIQVEMDDQTDITAGDIAKAKRKCKTCHAKDLKGKVSKKTGKQTSPSIAGMAKGKVLKYLTTKIPKKMKKTMEKLALTKAEAATVAAWVSKQSK
jgi:cytochrome c553